MKLLWCVWRYVVRYSNLTPNIKYKDGLALFRRKADMKNGISRFCYVKYFNIWRFTSKDDFLVSTKNEKSVRAYFLVLASPRAGLSSHEMKWNLSQMWKMSNVKWNLTSKTTIFYVQYFHNTMWKSWTFYVPCQWRPCAIGRLIFFLYFGLAVAGRTGSSGVTFWHGGTWVRSRLLLLFKEKSEHT